MNQAFREWFVHTPIWRLVRDHSTPERKKALLRKYVRLIGLWNEKRYWFMALRRLHRPWIYFSDVFSRSQSTQVLEFALRGGPKVFIRAGSNDRFIFDEIFFQEIYRRGLPPASATIKTIVDVGAQVGMTSLWLHTLYPEAQIYSLEPMPENASQLEKNIANNQWSSHIHAHRLALSDKKGEIVMTRNPENKGGHSMFAQEFHGEEVRVPCMSLEDFFVQQGIQACDFMKMDVEGAEYPIFYASSAQTIEKIRCLAMEHHTVAGHDTYHGAALEKFLLDHGFVVVRDKNVLFASRTQA